MGERVSGPGWREGAFAHSGHHPAADAQEPTTPVRDEKNLGTKPED